MASHYIVSKFDIETGEYDTMAKKKINIQRSAGGYVWHLVLAGERRALCGYAPGGTTRMGRGRARWANRVEYLPSEDENEAGTCPKCLKKHQAS